MIQKLKKCEKCGKMAIPVSSMSITNVLGKYFVVLGIAGDGSPPALCQECLARIVTQAGKDLSKAIGLEEEK